VFFDASLPGIRRASAFGGVAIAVKKYLIRVN
jgi:hypothetical protein